MVPMEVQCAIGRLTVPLDSNWPFHSSHFSTFPNGVKEELPRLWKCWGKLGNQNIFNVLWGNKLHKCYVFISTVWILSCGYHKEKIITWNSKSWSACVMNSLSKKTVVRNQNWEANAKQLEEEADEVQVQNQDLATKWNCWRMKRTRYWIKTANSWKMRRTASSRKPTDGEE